MNPNDVKFEGDSMSHYNPSSRPTRGILALVMKLFGVNENKANIVMLVGIAILLIAMIFFFSYATSTPQKQKYHRDGTLIIK
jgi:hypothetical protein